jgi:outer membrane protein OmpA-like peptidoglycan-associated protein
MHHSFGLVVRFGQGKDSDGDGVPDAQDKCPSVPGKPELNGCPDTDGDGILDQDDKCPTVAGLAQFQGCPDTDGDGIPDADDVCPNERGTLEMKGCPDRDGDGIADKDDKCPNEKGALSAQGCPDRDGDGIADREDACPDDKGPVATKGCPDTDGDGILDKDDKCPNIYGTAENHGCPQPALDATEKQAVQQKLNFAAKNIFFESGSDVIKKSSHTDLDSVAAVLNRYDFLKVSIEGHTDDVGPAKANVDLSNQRAAAVMNYLIAHGVLPTRLTALGYGPYKPVADNKTPEGRAKNRRVEINIKD